MDFYERLRSLKPQRYQEVWNMAARYGNPQEIFAYINAMPICCHEEPGLLGAAVSEVRIDSRFLVICRRKDIGIVTTDMIKNFFVSPWQSSSYCWFGVNDTNDLFFVDDRSGYLLYTQLLVHCPNFFQPMPNTGPVGLHDYRYSYLTIDSQNLTLFKRTLFGKIKTVLVIPLRNIRSCYQVTEDDSEGDLHDLYLRLYDGTEQRIGVYTNLIGFNLARQLKSVIPNLIYECKIDRK